MASSITLGQPEVITVNINVDDVEIEIRDIVSVSLESSGAAVDSIVHELRVSAYEVRYGTVGGEKRIATVDEILGLLSQKGKKDG